MVLLEQPLDREESEESEEEERINCLQKSFQPRSEMEEEQWGHVPCFLEPLIRCSLSHPILQLHLFQKRAAFPASIPHKKDGFLEVGRALKDYAKA